MKVYKVFKKRPTLKALDDELISLVQVENLTKDSRGSWNREVRKAKVKGDWQTDTRELAKKFFPATNKLGDKDEGPDHVLFGKGFVEGRGCSPLVSRE